LIGNPVLGGFGWGRPEQSPQKNKKKICKNKKKFCKRVLVYFVDKLVSFRPFLMNYISK
jgi:hypothetical protein